MVEKSDVAAVLELIRPSLQADGGDVQLVDVSDDGVVTVELQGACTRTTRRCEALTHFIFTLVLHAALAEANLVQRRANLKRVRASR